MTGSGPVKGDLVKPTVSDTSHGPHEPEFDVELYQPLFGRHDQPVALRHTEDLKGGIAYYDAQFNDARLNVLLARTAEMEGACVCNKVELISLIKNDSGKITGAVVKDLLSGKSITVNTKLVINTTGVFIDEIRKMDDQNAKSFPNVCAPPFKWATFQKTQTITKPRKIRVF